jgi:hypothetical protein
MAMPKLAQVIDPTAGTERGHIQSFNPQSVTA